MQKEWKQLSKEKKQLFSKIGNRLRGMGINGIAYNNLLNAVFMDVKNRFDELSDYESYCQRKAQSALRKDFLEWGLLIMAGIFLILSFEIALEFIWYGKKAPNNEIFISLLGIIYGINLFLIIFWMNFIIFRNTFEFNFYRWISWGIYTLFSVIIFKIITPDIQFTISIFNLLILGVLTILFILSYKFYSRYRYNKIQKK